jgi:cell division septation protein DedD
MPFVAFFLLLFCYLVTGYGLITLFGLHLRTAYMITLSLLLGVAVASFLPFLLQLLYIQLTAVTVFTSLLMAALAFNIPTLRRIRKEGWSNVRRTFDLKPFRILPYEIPYLVIFGFIVFVSIWRCYYLPPTSRDALSGPEAIAEFAVREHTMINSFFSIDLWSTNNQFKSPFLISLQMICKMAGFPFGQVWLSVVFVSFTVFLYNALKEKIHPILAGLLLLLFLMTPEMYAYTFMVLYDYSNMIFFFLSLYFLFDYFSQRAPAGPPSAASLPIPAGPRAPGTFYLSGLLMGIATYIRSETLILAFLFLPPILLVQFRQKDALKKMVRADVLFILPSLIAYYLTTQLYIKYYLPVNYDIGGLINDHLGDLHPLFQRYADIVTHLIGSEFGIHLWGYIFYVTAFLFLAEGIFRGRYSKEARNWLYAILVLYIGLGALGFALPMMNLNETTKRAMFKMLPLLLLYLANNRLLIALSEKISRWENAKPVAAVTSASKSASAKSASAKPASAKPAPASTNPATATNPATPAKPATPSTKPVAPASGKPAAISKKKRPPRGR